MMKGKITEEEKMDTIEANDEKGTSLKIEYQVLANGITGRLVFAVDRHKFDTPLVTIEECPGEILLERLLMALQPLSPDKMWELTVEQMERWEGLKKKFALELKSALGEWG